MSAAFESDAENAAPPTSCIPPDEAERMQALRRLKLLDTPPADSFDTVTRLASVALRLPIVLVSLVDADRQWFKSRVGLEASETPRNISFCAHAVFERNPLVIRDATKDQRFMDNPLVTGAPHIMSYVGIPLYTRDGYPIGTLCGIDRRRRDFGDLEVAMMGDFAKIVEVFVHAMELSAALVLARDSLQEQVALQTRKLQESNAALSASNARLAVDSITDYLTGLSNRRNFSSRSESAAHAFRVSGTPYGLILMDLDDFKHINDKFGHDAGDDVLRATGSILLAEMRDSTDVAGRLGGEEFAVLCPATSDEEGLRALAERIRDQINKAVFYTAKGTLSFSSSFGIALSQPGDTDWKAIYARADAALYEAKAAGKNRVVFGHTSSKESTMRLKALRTGSPGRD